MRSDRLKYLLPDYVTGSLAEAERKAVEQRIAENAAFRKEYERLASTMQLLEQSKEAEETPLAVQNILVQINAKLDEPVGRGLFNTFPAKLVLPALAVAAILVVLIISLPSNDEPLLPMISAGEIESTIQTTEFSDLVALQSEFEDEYILPNLLADEQFTSLQVYLNEDLTNSINEEIFDDLSYDDLISASTDYLSDDDLVESLSEQSLAELLEAVGDKTLL